MKKKDIFRKYKDEWALIGSMKVDEDFEVIEGDILYHSKDTDEVYKRLLELKPREYMIEYTGNIPEDLVVML
ncbi:MAG: hypothetical protein V1872_01630 [bacterium]